jgi:hypothetical protein
MVDGEKAFVIVGRISTSSEQVAGLLSAVVVVVSTCSTPIFATAVFV